MSAKHSLRDGLTALALAAILLVLCAMTLTAGHVYGDDFAAYLNQGIAISEGTLDELIRLQPDMHTSPAPFLSAEDETLTYVWGYPLVLAAIHRLVGFDAWTYATLIYYKLPVALCYAAVGAVLFLFYRRRFSWGVSLFLSLAFSLNGSFFSDADTISPDIPFLLFFLLSLLLIEIALDEHRFGRRMLWYGLLGVCMWYTYVLRLNGFTVLLIVGAAHAVRLFPQRKSLTLRSLWELLPYAVCFALLGLSYLFLPVPTSNLSDVGAVDFVTLLDNFHYYFDLLCEWLNGLFARDTSSFFYANFVGSAMLLLFGIGAIKAPFKQNFHLLLLVVSTLLTLAALPYRQGIRYTYSILPFLLMYAAYGAAFVARRLDSHMDHWLQKRSAQCIRWLGAVIAIVLVFQTGTYAVDRFQHRGDALPEKNQYYSTYAIDIYHYIQQNTPDDCVIAYYKPRSLYLNTGRLSFKPQVPDELVYNADRVLPYQNHRNELTDADYLLITDPSYSGAVDLQILSDLIKDSATLESVYQNPRYELYRICKL